MNLITPPTHSVLDRKDINKEKEWRECWTGPFIKTWTGHSALPIDSFIFKLFNCLMYQLFVSISLLLTSSLLTLDVHKAIASNSSMSVVVLASIYFSLRYKEYVSGVIFYWYLAKLTIDIWINQIWRTFFNSFRYL